MADALLTAVSGLQSQQTMLDVVGNNLANVNTVGFKSQTVDFDDIFYENLQQASANVSGLSGTDPIQVGLGVTVGGITTNFGLGSLQSTGNNLDLAIQGNGFFVVNNGNQDLYTQNGAFAISNQGYLVDPTTGNLVQRFGSVGETGPIQFQTAGNNNIQIPMGAGIPAQATTTANFQGNLDATTAVGGTYSTTIQVFDSQGNAHSMTAVFTKTAVNPDTYDVSLAVSGGEVNGSATSTSVGSVSFNADGSLGSTSSLSGINLSFGPSLPANQPITLDLGTSGQFNGLTEFGNPSSAAITSQDGSAAGALTSISIAQDGTVNGSFSNGEILPIAQLAIANFANPGGLERQGDNNFATSSNSGPPLIGSAGSGTLGAIQQGALEQSNVDVSLEFTKLIIAQRGFQVNARTISTVDDTMQSLVQIQ